MLLFTGIYIPVFKGVGVRGATHIPHLLLKFNIFKVKWMSLQYRSMAGQFRICKYLKQETGQDRLNCRSDSTFDINCMYYLIKPAEL